MAVGGVSSTRPRSGWMRPASTRSSVDLPTPFGPTRPIVSPPATVRSIESSTTSGPRRDRQPAGPERSGGRHPASVAAERRHAATGYARQRLARRRTRPTSTLRHMPTPGEHHPAFEEYCEAIFELAEDDVDVIQARIADRLQVSRPAVSEMMRRLEHEGSDLDRRRHPAHRRGPGPRRERRPPPPPRRAVPHRRAPPVVGRGAPRGRPVGARDEHLRRVGDGPPARQPDDVPARQPDPRLRLRRADRRAACRRSTSASRSRSAGSPRSSSSRQAARVPRGSPSSSRAPTARSRRCRPDGTLTVEIGGHHVGVGAFASARILVSV